MDEDSKRWADKQDADVEIGKQIIQKASNEALEYTLDAVENINDRAWRKMAVDTQAVEMGVGIGIAEHLVPIIYKDMEKSLHKKLKVSKPIALAIRHIYIGRVVKNLMKEMEKHGRD